MKLLKPIFRLELFVTLKYFVSSPVKLTAPPTLGEILVIVGAASGTRMKVSRSNAEK